MTFGLVEHLKARRRLSLNLLKWWCIYSLKDALFYFQLDLTHFNQHHLHFSLLSALSCTKLLLILIIQYGNCCCNSTWDERERERERRTLGPIGSHDFGTQSRCNVSQSAHPKEKKIKKANHQVSVKSSPSRFPSLQLHFLSIFCFFTFFFACLLKRLIFFSLPLLTIN